MSSHDVYFAAAPGAQPPTVDTIARWLGERPRWKVDGGQAEYENPLTGVDLNATIEADGDAPEGRVPVVVWMSGLRAHHAIEEMAVELEALVDAFTLLVVDDRDANTTRRFDRAWLFEEHEKFNRTMHDHRFRYLGSDHDEVLERSRLDEVIGWNRKRDELASAIGEEVFVPQILFYEQAGSVGTFVAWADGLAARVPRVDAIQTTRAFVPWSAIADALAGARREGDHWLVEGDAVAAVFAAIERATAQPPPRIVRPREVLTKELVDEYILPPEQRAARREAMEMLSSGRMARFTGKTEAEAVAAMVGAAELAPEDLSIQIEVARFVHEKAPADALRIAERVVGSHPDYTFVAVLGAANAMYLARWADAVRLANHALATTGDDRNAHLVRATALTELMQWDDAIAACDRALDLEADAMARNVKAYALAAAGRSTEARVCYEAALEELDASITESADDADLRERRAYALLGLERPKEALVDAKKAVSLEPESLLALQSVGRASVALGRAKPAIAALRKVIARRETSPMAALHLARAHAMLGQTAERDAALKLAAASPLQADLAAKDPSLVAGDAAIRSISK